MTKINTKSAGHLWLDEPVVINNSVQKSALLEYPDKRKISVWYRLPEEYLPYITDSSDCFILACLFSAMRQGFNLKVHGTASSSLLRNIQEFQIAWSKWRPAKYQPIDISADSEEDIINNRADDNPVMTFSGGIDSCFTAWVHAQKEGRCSASPLKTALMIHGHDIPLAQTNAFNHAYENSRRILDSIDMNLIPVTTNIRELSNSWQDAHGAAIISCFHLLSKKFSTGIIPSSHSYDTLVFPWGSNPITDPMLSSSLLNIKYDSACHTRIEKIRKIYEWEDAIQNIRICLKASPADHNCGVCTKCVGTALCFAAQGLKHPDVLNVGSLDSAVEKLAGLKLREATAKRFGEIVYAARASRVNAAWVDRLDKLITNKHKKRNRLRKIIKSISFSSRKRNNTTNNSHAESLYSRLDNEINKYSGGNTGCTYMLRPSPYEMSADTVQGFSVRYRKIKSFQEQALAVFKASLSSEIDPEIARMVLQGIPEFYNSSYHQRLSDSQHTTPVFFRTDEGIPGKLTEVQCCGSGWGIADQMWRLYSMHPQIYGEPIYFKRPLAKAFSSSLRKYLGEKPIIHHLIDNASIPEDARYFIQRTRNEGLLYYSYDSRIAPDDCNFIRSHDFVSLLYHNFLDTRLKSCNEGALHFDLPPSALFDGKLIMAWPFWERTKKYFSEEVRGLFPHTALIAPDGIEMENGERISIDDFCKIPNSCRNYYIKYAGTDITINWGSKAVFLASGMSSRKCWELLNSITTSEWAKGRYWIIQSSARSEETSIAITRDGDAVRAKAYAKWSGFYGADGLMAIMVMHKNFHKVHGSSDTVCSIVY